MKDDKVEKYLEELESAAIDKFCLIQLILTVQFCGVNSKNLQLVFIGLE